MVAMDGYLNGKNTAKRIVNGHSNVMNNFGIPELGNLPNSHHLGSPVLVHDPGFSVDWTADEQRILEEGLINFANEPPVMKYVKIAGSLGEKTTRDVAMRCNWMKKKRRKQDQPKADKNFSMRKLNMTPYSQATHSMNQGRILAQERYNGPFQDLLQENAQLISGINCNLLELKFQENLELFHRTRNNIHSVLNNMADLRGTLSPMPPLPMTINEDLANTVLQELTQARSMFGGLPNSSLGHWDQGN